MTADILATARSVNRISSEIAAFDWPLSTATIANVLFDIDASQMNKTRVCHALARAKPHEEVGHGFFDYDNVRRPC